MNKWKVAVYYMKKEKGEFVGISAPYGYLKEPKDKHKYILDEDASKVVVRIFDMALVGKTKREISEEMRDDMQRVFEIFE